MSRTNEGARVKILLVDDQPARLLSYEAILGDLGHELVRARSGAEALERLMHEEFALILLDVSMPVMDGFETAELIHKHPRFENTPIIFVTALHVTDLDRIKGYEVGAVDYVYVPVIPRILRNKVSVLAELYCKRRDLEDVNQQLKLANADMAKANSTLLAEKNRELQRLNGFLEESRARLKEADRRKDEFLAILAHELRNPLAPLQNGLQLLRRKKIQDEDVLQYLGMLERQVSSLTRLVDDLMDVSRIREGKLKLQKQEAELSAIVARALETCRPLFEEAQHNLTVEQPDEPILVEADPTRLAQVIGNLLSNAAKYTHPGGQIRLAVEKANGPCEVVIRVQDNGVGIPADVLPRLFELFAQAESTLDRSHGGLGVGLALVLRLVAMHSGSVTAHSEGPGKGSEFVVRLPMLRSALRSAEEAPQLTDPTPLPRRILVADDNVDLAASVSMLLRQDGHEVQVVNDGQSCLEVAATFRPQAVLLDIGMPRMNGYEVARRLRSQPGGTALHLIALTGWGQDDVRARVLESGFDAHLIKPIDVRVLARLLATLPTRGSRAVSST